MLLPIAFVDVLDHLLAPVSGKVHRWKGCQARKQPGRLLAVSGKATKTDLRYLTQSATISFEAIGVPATIE